MMRASLTRLTPAGFITAVVGGILLSFAPAYGQVDSYVELLRSDIRTEKQAILTQVMQFSDEQASVFWPIYREYDLELSKYADRRLALIKDYAANFEGNWPIGRSSSKRRESRSVESTSRRCGKRSIRSLRRSSFRSSVPSGC
jgi:hypothetical protein